MVPRLHGCSGKAGVTVAADPPLAICTLTVRAVGQTAVLVGTSEYASEKVVVACSASVSRVADLLAWAEGN